MSASIKLFSLHTEGTRWRKIHLKEEYTFICTWIDTTEMNHLVRYTPSFCRAWQVGFRSIKVSAAIYLRHFSFQNGFLSFGPCQVWFSVCLLPKYFPRTTESTAENSQTGLNMFCLKFSAPEHNDKCHHGRLVVMGRQGARVSFLQACPGGTAEGGCCWPGQCF